MFALFLIPCPFLQRTPKSGVPRPSGCKKRGSRAGSGFPLSGCPRVAGEPLAFKFFSHDPRRRSGPRPSRRSPAIRPVPLKGRSLRTVPCRRPAGPMPCGRPDASVREVMRVDVHAVGSGRGQVAGSEALGRMQPLLDLSRSCSALCANTEGAGKGLAQVGGRGGGRGFCKDGCLSPAVFDGLSRSTFGMCCCPPVA